MIARRRSSGPNPLHLRLQFAETLASSAIIELVRNHDDPVATATAMLNAAAKQAMAAQTTKKGKEAIADEIAVIRSRTLTRLNETVVRERRVGGAVAPALRFAAPKTPIEVREEVERMIEAGEVVKAADLKRLREDNEAAMVVEYPEPDKSFDCALLLSSSVKAASNSQRIPNDPTVNPDTCRHPTVRNHLVELRRADANVARCRLAVHAARRIYVSVFEFYSSDRPAIRCNSFAVSHAP